MENDIATEFMELRTVLVPKILDLAENEETASVKRFLDAYSHDEVSNGMLLLTTIIIERERESVLLHYGPNFMEGHDRCNDIHIFEPHSYRALIQVDV